MATDGRGGLGTGGVHQGVSCFNRGGMTMVTDFPVSIFSVSEDPYLFTVQG